MKQTLLIFAVLIFTLQLKAFDVPALCTKAAKSQIIQNNRNFLYIDPALLTSGTAQQIAQAIRSKTPPESLFLVPWLLQDMTRTENSKAAFLIQSDFGNKLSQQMGGKSAVDALKDATTSQLTYSPESLADSQRKMQAFLRIPITDDLVKLKRNAAALCLPYLELGCAKGIESIADVMGTRVKVAYISLPVILEKLLTDPVFRKALSTYALEIIDTLNGSRRGQLSGHFADDLINSFVKIGIPQKQAIEYGWMVLGFYGARGASIQVLETFFNNENYPTLLSLYVIYTSLGIFDSLTFSTGHPYSYPANIETHCPMQKPYHFWMSAFLTRILRKQGMNKRPSILAPHLVGMMYEFGANTVTRSGENERPYRDVFFNDYNVQVQSDIAYHDSGSYWIAITSQALNPLFIDEGMGLMFEDSKPMPKLTPEELEAGIRNDLTRYSWFQRVLAPDSFVKRILKELPPQSRSQP